MFVALIAAFGVLMTADDLAATSATSGLSGAAAVSPSDALSFAAGGADHGGLTLSSQAITGQVGDTRVSVGNEFRTGDIAFNADTVGGGVQALSIATGVGSLPQSAVSVAAGALSFGAPPK
jgi:hypothetical protein